MGEFVTSRENKVQIEVIKKKMYKVEVEIYRLNDLEFQRKS